MGKIIDGSLSVVFRLLSSACLRSKPHPDRVGLQDDSELLAVELSALVGVKNLRDVLKA